KRSAVRLFCAAERSKFLARRVRGEFFCNFSHGEKSSFFEKKNLNHGTHEKNYHRIKPTEQMTPCGIGRRKQIENEQFKINNEKLTINNALKGQNQ
ncbi:MAG: hypothetical protein J6Y82_12680, partial [Bacteroidales bacterium]|nr:hypothetical protein [Bacteroidales bacterium]